MESWQIFAYAKKVLPGGTLQRLYARSRRLVDLWAANPAHCEDTARNPLDRIRLMLIELDAAGYGHVARGAIDFLASAIGGRFEPSGNAKSDKGTVDGEIADALDTLSDLSCTAREAVMDGKLTLAEDSNLEEKARRARTAIDEILSAVVMMTRDGS